MFQVPECDRIAAAAMASLERQGVPAVKADMPGLYQTTRGELTFNQLIGLACALDHRFDPGRA